MAGSMPFPPFPNLPFDGPVTWPDPPGAAQRAPGRWPTVRVRTFTGGGYAVSVADSANDRFTLIEGSATSARVVHVNGGQWSETVAVAAGVPGVSSVVTRIGADPAGLLTGAARTVFTTGVVRQDSASSATGHIAAWTFPDGRSSQVTWGVDGRHEMVTSGPQGKVRRLLHTVADGPGRRVTQITDEAGNELGSTVAAFGLGGSVQLDTIGASGGVVAGKQPFDTTDSNGQRTWGELTVFESGAKEYQVYTSGPQGVGTDGTFTQEGWKSTPTPDGDVLMKTHYEAEADGSVHDYDVSLTNQQTGPARPSPPGTTPTATRSSPPRPRTGRATASRRPSLTTPTTTASRSPPTPRWAARAPSTTRRTTGRVTTSLPADPRGAVLRRTATTSRRTTRPAARPTTTAPTGARRTPAAAT
jgi:hypothetical protein